VLDLSSLDLEEIATALADQTDYEHRWLINPQTGEVVFWTSDTGIDGQAPVDLDELDLICIDPLPSYIWYQDMADFADQIRDERAGRRLARAIQGKGAFRRFKAELHEENPQLLPAWYAFRDARARRRAVEWLADSSLVDPHAATRFLDEHPEPNAPRPREVAAMIFAVHRRTSAVLRAVAGGNRLIAQSQGGILDWWIPALCDR
jgi:hypothetical protein